MKQLCNIFFLLAAVQEFFFRFHLCCMQFFFFQQALAGILFSKSPPPPQELNGRPLSGSFCCVRDWLEVIRSNQQDQLARAELFIFSNCRDPHTVVVSIKKGNNYNCSVHFCRGKQRLLLLTMACNSSISMYETL